ncbi:hypothetical protein HYR69_07745, partial [Candidatus Sumerlaeota bacterium]|nr:hypothetical protein [Candidatus Sumerlaeota bacterium]
MSETGQDGMGRGETSPDPRPNGSTAETQLHENFNMFLFRPGTSYPAMMQIETTSRCNLKCPNCRRTIEFPDAADAQSEHVLEKLRDPIARLDSLAISGWGESLMGRSLGAVLHFGLWIGI